MEGEEGMGGSWSSRNQTPGDTSPLWTPRTTASPMRRRASSPPPAERWTKRPGVLKALPAEPAPDDASKRELLALGQLATVVRDLRHATEFYRRAPQRRCIQVHPVIRVREWGELCEFETPPPDEHVLPLGVPADVPLQWLWRTLALLPRWLAAVNAHPEWEAPLERWRLQDWQLHLSALFVFEGALQREEDYDLVRPVSELHWPARCLHRPLATDPPVPPADPPTPGGATNDVDCQRGRVPASRPAAWLACWLWRMGGCLAEHLHTLPDPFALLDAFRETQRTRQRATFRARAAARWESLPLAVRLARGRRQAVALGCVDHALDTHTLLALGRESALARWSEERRPEDPTWPEWGPGEWAQFEGLVADLVFPPAIAFVVRRDTGHLKGVPWLTELARLRHLQQRVWAHPEVLLDAAAQRVHDALALTTSTPTEVAALCRVRDALVQWAARRKVTQ